jgi:hypothetical protein
MAPGPETPSPPPRGRLIGFYAFLAAMVAVVSVVVISAGQEKEAQPSIAGGYDVAGAQDPCLGAKFDVKQSGQFVNLDNADGSLGGRLEADEGRVTGDVDCVRGGKAKLDVSIADGRLAGTVGGRELKAELKRDPPEAGAQKPRAPGSIAGDYRLSPRSPCLGAKLDVEGDSQVELHAKEKVVGEGRYSDGKLTGDIRARAVASSSWRARPSIAR